MAGHAGTVPMRLRRDALAAAAECVLAVELLAGSEADLVGTVGKIEALPGAINVIPGRVRFSLDVRAPTDGSASARSTRFVARSPISRGGGGGARLEPGVGREDRPVRAVAAGPASRRQSKPRACRRAGCRRARATTAWR